ncbi:MAG: peptidoglycan DD-metalloendopeptidase family protein [Tannerella sp.]|jgi:murein DD-endopeptidase MepM/ murein hydrolase activator NlpD|nr:peptidoglycan DD-metalloendopeptidase family protein [Tannerella sp.]
MTTTIHKIKPSTTCLKWISLFFLCLLVCISCKKTTRPETEDDDEVDSEWIENQGHLYEYGICIDSLDITNYTIKNGDSPSAIFTRLGFSAAKTDSLCKVSAKVFDPKKLRAGMTYTTITVKDSLASIQYIIFAQSMTDFSIIDLTGEDGVKAYAYNKEIRFERRYLEGVITSSLWNIIKNNGADPLLALKISDILAWQVDFFDVKEGDSFRVVYDVAFIDDTTELNVSSIEGLVFAHRKKEYTAIPFTQDSVREYFDREGNSLRGAFLKAPLDFFRITSRFTNARFHPILKRYRAHHGVDYAAPVGTPVKTIGDGTVTAKGFDQKGGGNFVKIKHNSVYTTTYMHLSRFGKGIQQGAHVKQGNIIGYVGSTGLSTGPHLDFRVHKNGQPIDPLKMESPPAEPVKAGLRDSFEIVKRNVLAEMDSLQSAANKQTVNN